MPGTSKLKFNRLSDLAAAGQLKGKRVFIRADLNVPQDEAGNITEDTRIRASIPAIKLALEAGAAVMVTSHLGRPTEGEFKPEDTLAPVADRIAELMERKVPLISHWVDGGFELQPGDLVLLENCRLNKGEKKNNEELAQKMAKLCDVYVNDAFGTAHRAEATTHGMAKYAPVVCAGPLMAADLNSVALVCRLTRDADIRITASGVDVANLRVAFTTRQKVDGAWQDAANGRMTVIAGTPLTSTFLNFMVGTGVLLIATAFHSFSAGLPAALPTQPYFYLGGAIGVVFIGITAVVVREIGVLLMGLGSIAGQLLMAVILDFFFPSAQVTGVMILIGASLAFVAAAWAAWPKKKPHAHVAESVPHSGE